MRRRFARAAVALAMLAVVGACTAEPMTPSPPSTRGYGDRVPLSERPVPAVTAPLELGEFANRPCGLLTDDPHDELVVYFPGKPKVEGDRQVCQWFADGPVPELELIPYPDRDILREIYATTPNSVSYVGAQKHRDMPAVSVVVSLDAEVCTLTVGLSDSQGIQLRDHGARHGGPPINCDQAQVAAGMAIDTLRARSRR